MIGKFSLGHLHLLVALSKTNSLTAAASHLNLTQSAASHQIREMERRLGVRLFQRNKNKLLFTSIGERMLASAKIIVEEATDIQLAISRIRSQVEVAVRIGIRGQNCYWWLAKFLNDTKTLLESQDVQIFPSSGGPLELLKAGEVDIELAHSTYAMRRFESIELFEDELVAFVPADHPFAKEKFLDSSHLVKERYITYSAIAEEGLEYDRLMKPAGLMPQRLLVVGSFDACLACVEAGLGFTCLPRSALGPSGRWSNMVVKPLTPKGMPVMWRVFMRKNQSQDSPPAKFAKLLAAWIRNQKWSHSLNPQRNAKTPR